MVEWSGVEWNALVPSRPVLLQVPRVVVSLDTALHFTLYTLHCTLHTALNCTKLGQPDLADVGESSRIKVEQQVDLAMGVIAWKDLGE
jgi:hypothetical protein